MTNNRIGKKRKFQPFRWLLRVIQGSLIGAGAILPGISGGVLCVSFGIYQPMMAVLAQPKVNLPKYFRLLLPVLIGWVLGFFFFARLIELMFSVSEVLAMWLFIGLIAGTLPSLLQDSGSKGRTPMCWVSGFIAFALFFGFMLYAQYGGISANLTPNLGWFFFCGVLWGLSLVVPGMTSSSILMSMGLFMPMTSGIADMDMGVVIPMVLGVIVVVLLTARLVNYLFNRFYAIAYHCIIGLVLASTLVIVPLKYNGIGEVLGSVAVAAVGFIGAWAMERFVGKEE